MATGLESWLAAKSLNLNDPADAGSTDLDIARRPAAEIRIRAERRIGELIKAQKEAGLMNRGGGDQKTDHRVANKPSDLPSLSEAGIDKNLAKRARQLAAVPDPVRKLACR